MHLHLHSFASYGENFNWNYCSFVFEIHSDLRNYQGHNAFSMADSISYSSFNVLPCSTLLVQVSDINSCIWCGLLADDMQRKLSTHMENSSVSLQLLVSAT